MEEQAVKQQMQELIAQINYHNQKYYVEDAPEIDDYEYDMLYRQLQQLENDHPEWIQPDSPTQRVGGAPLNTFEKVEHEVPMESLHDSFSEEELMDFDRRVREVVSDPVYIVEPKFEGYPFPWSIATASLCAVPPAGAAWLERAALQICGRFGPCLLR